MDCNVIKVTNYTCNILKLNSKYIGYYIILKEGSDLNKILPIDKIQRITIANFNQKYLVQTFVMMKKDNVYEVQLYKQPMEYVGKR